MAKDKAKFIKTIKNTQTKEQFDRVLPDIISRVNKYLEMTGKNITEKAIKKELKRTKPLKVGQKKIGKYDYESNKLFETLRKYDKMTQSQASEEFEKFPESPTSEMDLIKKRMLSLKSNGKNASLDIYNQVLKDIQRMKEAGEQAKTEADFGKLIERAEQIDEALDGINKIKADKKTILTKIGNTYRRGFSNLWSMLNSTFGKGIADKYNMELNESEKVTAVYLKTGEEMPNEMKTIYGKQNSFEILEDLSRDKFEITDIDGLTTEITRLELIDIYNSLKNDKKKQDYYDTFGEDQITYLMGELTPEDVNFADYLQETVQEYRDIINQRNIEITGRDLGFIENYWPATSEHRIDLYDDIKVQGETPSAMKERAKGRVIPVPRNAWYKAQRHIAQAEHVSNVSRKYETVKRLFTDRKVKHAIEQKFGKDVYNVLMNQIEELSLNSSIKNIDDVSRFFGHAVNNWVTAKIAIPNTNVFVRQLMSMGNFAEDMDSGEWVKGFREGLKTPKETFNFMWKNSPYIKARFNRGYSEALKNAIEGAEKLNAHWGEWTKFLTYLARVGDITAIIYGGHPLVKSELSKGKNLKQAIKTFELASIRAQQSGLSSSLSQFQNSKNPFARLFLAFKNTSTQYLRKMVDATISYKNGDVSQEQYAKTMFIYAIIQPILYASAGILTKTALVSLGQFLTGKPPEDEETLEEVMTKILSQIAISPVNAVPLLDDITQFAVRKATKQKVYKIFSTPLLDDLETGFSKLNKKKITAEDYLTISASILEPATAVPLRTTMRYFKYLGFAPDKKEKSKQKGRFDKTKKSKQKGRF